MTQKRGVRTVLVLSQNDSNHHIEKGYLRPSGVPRARRQRTQESCSERLIGTRGAGAAAPANGNHNRAHCSSIAASVLKCGPDPQSRSSIFAARTILPTYDMFPLPKLLLVARN